MIHRFLAQQIVIQGQTLQGPLGPEINNIGDLVNKLVDFVMPLAGIILIFVMILGGYDYVLSHGDAAKLKSAKSKITAGLIGFVLIVVAYTITKLIAMIFGLNAGVIGN